jgi:site-specific DNA-cytosine methylase
MRVLIACEFSGIVREAFKKRGHDAWSCDLLPTEIPGQHYQGNIFDFIKAQHELYADPFDLMIAHPPCTHLACSGARWFKDKVKEQAAAVEFVKTLMAAPIPKIAVENPVGVLSTKIRKPDQIIQPFYFGDSVQKATCLWLKGLPKLEPTNIVDRGLIYVDPRGNKHGGVHTMRAKVGYSPLMLLPRNEERWKIRSRTFKGIGAAMANQWG